jgi:hypothetical protein
VLLEVALLMEYHTVMLYANLLRISDGRTPIAPPFTEDMISPKLPVTDLPALGKCVGSAQAVLDSFLRLSPEEIPSVPGIIFPRMLHALLILIVAALTILGSRNSAHSGEVAEDIARLEIDQYFGRVLQVFERSPGPENGRARKATKLLTSLKWYPRVILSDPHDSGSSTILTAPGEDGDQLSNGLGAESRDPTSIDISILPASIRCHPESSLAGSPPHATQQPSMSSISAVLESGDFFPLREDQYAFFASLVERPDGPPWTLFDDAMGVFDFM